MLSLWTIINDWLIWIAGLLATLLSAIGIPIYNTVDRSKDNQEAIEKTQDRLNDRVWPRVEENAIRSKKNHRRLTGDDADPHNDGILEIVSDNNDKIGELEARMEEQHERVLDALEEDDTRP